MANMTAKDIRKGRKKLENKPCFICGKHKAITQLHHILPLSKCAEAFNHGIISEISIPMLWLCPNCHAYVHEWIKRDFVGVMREEKIYQSISENEFSQIKEIGNQANEIYGQLLMDWAEVNKAQ